MKVKGLTLSGVFLLLGLVLPFVTGQIPQFGSMLLPMHLPAMFAGLCLPLSYAALLGFMLPLLRSLLFSMPPMYPTALAMAFELMAYAVVINLVYGLFKNKNTLSVYVSLIASMLAGRTVWGLVMYVLMGIGFEAFMASAFINAIPGIVLQLVLVPLIMNLLKRYL